MENNKELQNEPDNGTIIEPEPISVETPKDDGAGSSSPEETPDAYKEIIRQQAQTIDALINRTNELTGQITQLINMGVQITDGKQTEPQTIEPALLEDYVSLADLGTEIGKHGRS